MTAISKNFYFDGFIKLLKWNLLTLQMSLMLNTMKVLIKKDPEFKVGDNVRISKNKNIFIKDILQIDRRSFCY